jgi:hypothetical protein
VLLNLSPEFCVQQDTNDCFTITKNSKNTWESSLLRFKCTPQTNVKDWINAINGCISADTNTNTHANNTADAFHSDKWQITTPAIVFASIAILHNLITYCFLTDMSPQVMMETALALLLLTILQSLNCGNQLPSSSSKFVGDTSIVLTSDTNMQTRVVSDGDEQIEVKERDENARQSSLNNDVARLALSLKELVRICSQDNNTWISKGCTRDVNLYCKPITTNHDIDDLLDLKNQNGQYSDEEMNAKYILSQKLSSSLQTSGAGNLLVAKGCGNVKLSAAEMMVKSNIY